MYKERNIKAEIIDLIHHGKMNMTSQQEKTIMEKNNKIVSIMNISGTYIILGFVEDDQDISYFIHTDESFSPVYFSKNEGLSVAHSLLAMIEDT